VIEPAVYFAVQKVLSDMWSDIFLQGVEAKNHVRQVVIAIT